MNKIFEKTIYIPKKDVDYINRLLTVEPKTKSECQGEDNTIVYTATFDNENEMDIKCCGVQFTEGESNLSWSEAVLFHNRNEVACSEVEDTFTGKWELAYNGDTYRTIIKTKS